MDVAERRGVGGWLVALLGVVIGLIGLVLAGGGAWLVILKGSPYYLLAGLGLIGVGWLLIKQRMAAVWLYLLIFLATVVWAVWEVGLNGWALVPRIVAPAVLLFLVLLSIPALARFGRSGRATLIALVAFMVAALVGAVVVAQANRPFAARPLPAERASLAARTALQTGADWPAYGGTYAAQRYSPLGQITAGNVKRLERAWTYRTGDLPPKHGAETTPLKVGNTLYLCSARNILIALDARTGKQIWRYDPKVSDAYVPYTAACRGVAYYAAPSAAAGPVSAVLTPPAAVPAAAPVSVAPASPEAAPPAAGPTSVAPGGLCAARIIEGTLDGRLIAVDAASGTPCPGFGVDGAVDIKVGMGDVPPGMVSITSPPTIVRGVVVTGHQVLDGQERMAPSGVIQGFDAVTGQLRWAWDLAAPETTGLPAPGKTYTRGTPNMWTTASGDEALGLVYLPLGVSAADYWSSSRTPLEDRYATSLVAVDVATGKPAWHFQTVHVDVWDYDLGAQATLVDFPSSAGTIPALVLPTKRGDIFVLDRRSGVSLTRVEERPVPQGGVEPKRRTATQPFSTYHTLAKAPLTERDMWGMSPIDQMVCRIQFRQARYDGPFTPPTTDRRFVEYPGYNGGTDWGGVAVDPQHGVIVANYNDMPNYNRLIPRAEVDRKGWTPRSQARGGALKAGAEGAGDPQVGTPFGIQVNAGWRMPLTGLLCKQPPYGGIRAIELATGKTLWDRPLGEALRNGPFGIPSNLPLDIGTPNNGGAVVTGGGLIFVAAATDDLIRAIDLRTGKVVWTDKLPAGGQATPMTYEANGRQYLVIMAGGHHFMETPAGDYVIAYALPER